MIWQQVPVFGGLLVALISLWRTFRADRQQGAHRSLEQEVADGELRQRFVTEMWDGWKEQVDALRSEVHRLRTDQSADRARVVQLETALRDAGVAIPAAPVTP